MSSGDYLLREEPKKTIHEWCEIKGIEMMDPDGFDRTDTMLWERTYTEKDFDKRIFLCTIKMKETEPIAILSRVIDSLREENEQLRQEVEDYKLKEKICSECETHPEYLGLKKENEQLRNDVINSEMNLSIMLGKNEQLKEMLRKCSPFKEIFQDSGQTFVECEFCRADGYNSFVSKVVHNEVCEYVRLTKV